MRVSRFQPEGLDTVYGSGTFRSDTFAYGVITLWTAWNHVAFF
jgi:hypothetical protein